MDTFKLDMWSSWLQNDIDKDRAVMDTINALVVVAAFIAGVQGQIIQFTISLPLNALGRSTNFFAFSGLMLDIIGTFSGVIHALVLQQRINKSTGVLNYLTQTRAGFETKAGVETQTGTSEKPGGTDAQLLDLGIKGQNALRKRVSWLENEMRRRFLTRGPAKKMLPLLARMVPSPLLPPIPVEELPGSEQAASPITLASPFELGHTPLISMGLGVIALVISIILFAAETTSLASEVWMTCLVVPFTVMIFSLVPISYSVIKRMRTKRKPNAEANA